MLFLLVTSITVSPVWSKPPFRPPQANATCLPEYGPEVKVTTCASWM